VTAEAKAWAEQVVNGWFTPSQRLSTVSRESMFDLLASAFAAGASGEREACAEAIIEQSERWRRGIVQQFAKACAGAVRGRQHLLASASGEGNK
jgi:hypothetical protein